MTDDVWRSVLISYTSDERTAGAAIRELWCDGATVEEISEWCRLDEWAVRDALNGVR